MKKFLLVGTGSSSWGEIAFIEIKNIIDIPFKTFDDGKIISYKKIEFGETYEMLKNRAREKEEIPPFILEFLKEGYIVADSYLSELEPAIYEFENEDDMRLFSEIYKPEFLEGGVNEDELPF